MRCALPTSGAPIVGIVKTRHGGMCQLASAGYQLTLLALDPGGDSFSRRRAERHNAINRAFHGRTGPS